MTVLPLHPKATRSSRTTLPIAEDLLGEANRLIGEGAFASRAALVDLALRRFFWDLEDQEMHAAFEEAVKDPVWIAESVALAEEGTASGWEVIELGEQKDGDG